jgi:hypothetical protein
VPQKCPFSRFSRSPNPGFLDPGPGPGGGPPQVRQGSGIWEKGLGLASPTWDLLARISRRELATRHTWCLSQYGIALPSPLVARAAPSNSVTLVPHVQIRRLTNSVRTSAIVKRCFIVTRTCSGQCVVYTCIPRRRSKSTAYGFHTSLTRSMLPTYQKFNVLEEVNSFDDTRIENSYFI